MNGGREKKENFPIHRVIYDLYRVYILRLFFHPISFFRRVTQSGTSWHNARWNAGIRGLRNDFVFVDKLSGQAYGWILLDLRAGRSHEHRESILERSTWPLTV